MSVTKVQNGALLAINSRYRASWYTWCQNQWGINSIAYSVEGLTGAPTMGDLAEGLQSLTEANQKNWLPTQASILGVRTTQLTNVVPRSIAGVATSDQVGLVTGPPVPTQSTGILSFLTASAGRKYRGRIFTPFVAPSFVGSDGLPTNTYKGLIGSFATLTTTLPITITTPGGDTIDIEPLIYHRSTNTSNLVIGYQARPYWGTMKKRGDLGRVNPKSIPL